MKTKNLPASNPPAIVEREKSFDTTTSLVILKEFYQQAKKELKKNDQSTVNFRNSNTATHLTFYCEGFNLELKFSENS